MLHQTALAHCEPGYASAMVVRFDVPILLISIPPPHTRQREACVDVASGEVIALDDGIVLVGPGADYAGEPVFLGR